VTATKRPRAQRGSGEQLREEIVAATRDLLASSGNSDAVSIRKVADAVGVTSPSIYLHFADKWALLEAVVASVFDELDQAMLAAAVGIEDPMEVLSAYGLAYVDFALHHPEHYRLATMERHTDLDEMSHLDRVLDESAFAHMLAAVNACIADGVYAHGDALTIALELWTAAHGIAALMITKPFLPWGDPMEFARRVLGGTAMGLSVIDLHGGDMTPEQGRAWVHAQRAPR
jgi:AcrR family transcriptional regulator